MNLFHFVFLSKNKKKSEKEKKKREKGEGGGGCSKEKENYQNEELLEVRGVWWETGWCLIKNNSCGSLVEIIPTLPF